MRRSNSSMVYQSLPEIPRRARLPILTYFHNYAKLSKEEAVNTAASLRCSLLNLKQNILPTTVNVPACYDQVSAKSCGGTGKIAEITGKKGVPTPPFYYSALRSDISPSVFSESRHPVQAIMHPEYQCREKY